MSGRVGAELVARIEAALAPAALEVVDQSHLHVGHAGARPEGETHFHVVVIAPAFGAMSRLERQRAVMAAAGDLMRTDIHALTIRALSPEEAGSEERTAGG